MLVIPERECDDGFSLDHDGECKETTRVNSQIRDLRSKEVQFRPPVHDLKQFLKELYS